MDAVDERLLRVDRNRHLADHAAGVDAVIDVVDGHAGRRNSGVQGVDDRLFARELRQERRVDVDDPVGEPLEERLRQQMHVAREDDEVNAAKLEPVGELRVAVRAIRVALEREDARRDAGGARPFERSHAVLIRRHACDREPRVDQRLQVRPLAADEDTDHRSSPITSAPGGGSATTAHIPIPTLKTRRCSSSPIPCSVSQPKTRGRSHASQSMRASTSAGRTRDRLPTIPPPVTCASAFTSARARSSRIESRYSVWGASSRSGSKSSSPTNVRTSVKPFVWRTLDKKPTTASPGAQRVPSIRSSRPTTPTQVPAKSSSSSR